MGTKTLKNYHSKDEEKIRKATRLKSSRLHASTTVSIDPAPASVPPSRVKSLILSCDRS